MTRLAFLASLLLIGGAPTYAHAPGTEAPMALPGG